MENINVEESRKAIEKVKQVLRETKKNKGDVYLVNFTSGLWEKVPENSAKLKVLRIGKHFGKEGKLKNTFFIEGVDEFDYSYGYNIILDDGNVLDLIKDEFEVITKE